MSSYLRTAASLSTRSLKLQQRLQLPLRGSLPGLQSRRTLASAESTQTGQADAQPAISALKNDLLNQSAGADKSSQATSGGGRGCGGTKQGGVGGAGKGTGDGKPQPRILVEEPPPPDVNEDVKKHNEELKAMHDRPILKWKPGESKGN